MSRGSSSSPRPAAAQAPARSHHRAVEGLGTAVVAEMKAHPRARVCFTRPASSTTPVQAARTRLRWSGKVRMAQVPPTGGSDDPSTTPLAGGLAAAEYDCVSGPNGSCVGGDASRAELLVDIDALIKSGKVHNGGSETFFLFHGFGENTDGYSSADADVRLYLDQKSAYANNAARPCGRVSSACRASPRQAALPLRPLARRGNRGSAVGRLLCARCERFESSGGVLRACREAVVLAVGPARVEAFDGGFARGIVRAGALLCAAVCRHPLRAGCARVGSPFEERLVAGVGACVGRGTRLVALVVRTTAAGCGACLSAGRGSGTPNQRATVARRRVALRARVAVLPRRARARTRSLQRDDRDRCCREGSETSE